MNISPDGLTVRFETESEELFALEKSDAKSNVLCVMDFEDWHLLKQHNPTKIIIQHHQEFFLRTLTNIHLAGEMLNTWVVVFSWTHEKHYPPLSDENTPDTKDKFSPVLLPIRLILDLSRHRRSRSHADFISDLLGVHIMSQEQTTPSIKLAKTRRCPDCGGYLMNTRPGEFVKCPICRTLFCLDPGVETAPAKEEVMSPEKASIDERFAAITISNGTLALLQSIAHGRTMNMVIKELYEEYTCTRAKEQGALND